MKKIYLSPERRPAPHGPYFGYPTLFEHDVTTSIAQKTAAALTRCNFMVKIASPADDLRARVREAISWQADYYLPIHTNASSATPREGSARGPEVLAYGQPGGISWRACQMTYEELMAIYPAATTRGVRQNTTFYEINSTPMLSVYPELAFHDNGADAQAGGKPGRDCRSPVPWGLPLVWGKLHRPRRGGLAAALPFPAAVPAGPAGGKPCTNLVGKFVHLPKISHLG